GLAQGHSTHGNDPRAVRSVRKLSELGPDFRLRPAGDLPEDTLTALVTEGDGGHPVVAGLVAVDRVFAVAESRPGFSHIPTIPVWLLQETWLFGPSSRTA